jgi:hypothetical protein
MDNVQTHARETGMCNCAFMSWQERSTSIFFFSQSQELHSRTMTVNLIVSREVRTMSVAHGNVISTLHCL